MSNKVKNFILRKKSEETKKCDYTSESVSCGSGLAGKICRHNSAKLNKNAGPGIDKEKYERCVDKVKRKGSADNAYAVCNTTLKSEVKKAVDFQHTKSSVETADQMLAEKTTAPELISYIKSMISAIETDVTKIPFVKGTLTLSAKEPGLFNGFFSDTAGQIIEKFDNQTVETVAKNMELKNLYDAPKEAAPVPVDPVAPNHDIVEDLEDRAIAQDEAMKLLQQHNAIYHQGQAPGEPIGSKKGYIKIKYGDFELELKKSVKAFVDDFRLNKSLNQDIVRKAIRSWRKRYEGLKQFGNEQAAAREILSDWNSHGEELSQIVCGLTAMENDRDGQE